MVILITGGAGFIGSNFIRYLINEADTGTKIINLDKLTYAGNLGNLDDIANNSRYTFIKGDISDITKVGSIFEQFKPDAVVNFAAESHVDRSIEDSGPFIRTNVLGTQVLLDCARRHNTKRFLHISTDEVYGQLGKTDPPFTEETSLSPSSPYAASKAGADHLALSYHHTYAQDIVITRCSNNYGPRQFPEKLIPLMIQNAINNDPLPVYGTGSNIRDWIHVTDHCTALYQVLLNGRSGGIYNIGGNEERKNIEVVREILAILDKPESLIRFVEDRPGHDFRYAMNIDRISSELGWVPSITFTDGIRGTINWYLENRDWIDNIISGGYQEYYKRMYGNRLEKETEGSS